MMKPPLARTGLFAGLLGALPCFLACSGDTDAVAPVAAQALSIDSTSDVHVTSTNGHASSTGTSAVEDIGDRVPSAAGALTTSVAPGRTAAPGTAAPLADASGTTSAAPVGPAIVGDGGGVREFKLGDPIEGLREDELAAFERGRLVFERRWTPTEGLGPFYNAVSCASCHSTPVAGGSAPLYRNFYLGVFGSASSQGPSIPPFLSAVVPAFGSGEFHETTTEFTLEGPRTSLSSTVMIDGFTFPVIMAQRNAPPVFGTGLFEFVSDEEIMSNADPSDSNGDGIRGRWNTQNGNIGRFGFKAQSNNIELFTRGPLQNQMGITSDPFLGPDGAISLGASALQVSADPDRPTVDNDPAPDPEISHQDLGDLIAFTRFLAPPKPKPFNAEAIAGQQRFDEIGCARCHVPKLESSRGPVNAYTNLLLHYMGTQLADDIRMDDGGFNSARFFRTAPLWGVSGTAPYLHDGRAETLEEAILAHGGEAQGPRNNFFLLTAKERQELITFLEHL